nr:histidine kinase [Bacteroidota bacterium]
KLATVYNDSAWVLQDSVLSIEKQKAVAEIQTRYETEKKEHQIFALEAKNQVNELQLERNRLILFGTVLLTLIILITVILLFRQNRLQNQQKMLALEQKLLRAQMNPHFIFNSLASIQNFIVSQDPVKASIYLSRFSDLVRSILINSAEEFVPLEKEIKTIENYLELQKIRFPDKFTYSLEVDETIDTESIKIPPMLAQPFIENSIEHGIRHKKETGHINIRFTLQDGAILFEVKDNGVGRARAQEIEIASRSGHRSMATSITTDRLKALNKKLRKKIRLNIIDLESSVGEPTGTKVVFDIPYRLA